MIIFEFGPKNIASISIYNELELDRRKVGISKSNIILRMNILRVAHWNNVLKKLVGYTNVQL